MASIQQSLNQLLGATAGAATMGSYMIRQSPTYQRKQEVKGLKSEIEDITAAQGFLGEKAYEQGEKSGTPYEDTAAYKAADDLQPQLYEKRKRLLQLDWNEDTAKAVANDRAALEDIWSKIDPKKKAEDNSLSRLQEAIEAQTEQKNGLKDRFDRLREVISAKERGQLDTMYNRHKNKGELD